VFFVATGFFQDLQDWIHSGNSGDLLSKGLFSSVFQCFLGIPWLKWTAAPVVQHGMIMTIDA
jgi:hypothetical protein